MPTKQTESAPSFLQVYTQVRRDRMKHSFLRQISACVDWRGIRTLLNKKYTKIQNATGNPAYDALMMFKILLLQTWYGLSDYEVEERINDSILSVCIRFYFYGQSYPILKRFQLRKTLWYRV